MSSISSFVLGVLVFIHELGHFLAARRVGIRVLTFSLGFGPKLLKLQRGDTEYCISALPLGGYVKMAGEAADEPRTGAPDEFLSKTKWQRFQVLIMGPVMNILLAIVVLAVVLAQGERSSGLSRRAAGRRCGDSGSPAERAGIQPGDRIVASGRRPDCHLGRSRHGDRDERRQATSRVTFRAMGAERARVQCARSRRARYEFGDIGVEPDVYPVVRQTSAGRSRGQGRHQGW